MTPIHYNIPGAITITQGVDDSGGLALIASNGTVSSHIAHLSADGHLFADPGVNPALGFQLDANGKILTA